METEISDDDESQLLKLNLQILSIDKAIKAGDILGNVDNVGTEKVDEDNA